VGVQEEKEYSMKTDRKRKNTGIAVIRWSARILGLVIGVFFLLMFIGESLQSNSLPKALEPFAAIGLALMGIYIVAMFLAFKWERVSVFLGMVALGCFYVILFLGLLPGNVSGGFSIKGILNPFFLVFWLPFLLYLLCWGLERRRRETDKPDRGPRETRGG
jgi:hypothetical protein